MISNTKFMGVEIILDTRRLERTLEHKDATMSYYLTGKNYVYKIKFGKNNK